MPRKSRLAIFALTLGLALSARPSLAASGDPLEKMTNDGWKPVNAGVMQRARGGTKVERLVFGVEGFAWKLQDLQTQLARLRKELAAHPTAELRQSIASHRREIASTQKVLASLQGAGKSAAIADSDVSSLVEKVSCAINFGYDADAYSLTSSQGVGAVANANFSSNCAFSGEVYAYSYSKATKNGLETVLTKTDGPFSGAGVTASATGSVIGNLSCYSYAYASMTTSSLNPSSYTIEDTNTSCPVVATPPTVTVASDSPSLVFLTSGSCATITWTATVSGGAAPVTVTMYRNNVSLGVRTSYSQTYCGTGSGLTQTVNVYATVSDAIGQTATSNTHTTSIKNASTTTCGSRFCEPQPIE